MKIDKQEGCEYRFASILIDFGDFSCLLQFQQKTNETIKGKGLEETF